MDIYRNENKSNFQMFRPRLASWGHLFVISDIHISFQKYREGPNDHKGPESINYTIVKYIETFYGRHTTTAPDKTAVT